MWFDRLITLEHPKKGGLADNVMPRLHHLSEYKNLRKSLRNSATLAERKLWRYLQRSQFHGLKFRRQEGLGRYIVDFYCPKLRLAIEIDGASHNNDVQREYDKERTEYLNACFINVIRFTNLDVLQNIDGVLDKLTEVCLAHPKAPPEFGRGCVGTRISPKS